MVENYWDHTREGINYMRLNDKEIDPEGHVTDLLTEWSVDYIKERANYDQPFFLYLSHLAPHFPVQPPKEWLERVKNREPRSEEHTSELQSRGHSVCRLLLEKKKDSIFNTSSIIL